MNQENILDLPIKISEKKEETVKDIIPEIIKGNTLYMIEAAKKVGFYLGHELPKRERLYLYQIRKIFGSIKRLEMENFNSERVLLLKPRLVFAASKTDATRGIQYLKDILVLAIDQVENDENRFKNFVTFFESIIAYHQSAEKG